MNLEVLLQESEDETFKNCLNKMQTILKTISSVRENNKIKTSLYKDLFTCIDELWTYDHFEFMFRTNRVFIKLIHFKSSKIVCFLFKGVKQFILKAIVELIKSDISYEVCLKLI